MKLSILGLVLVAACGASPAPAPPTPTTKPDTTPDADAGSAASTTGLGEKCPENGCPTGQACVHYFGIAGKSGPEFTSCEIACAEKSACPTGTKCVTIADGPGAVCRP